MAHGAWRRGHGAWRKAHSAERMSQGAKRRAHEPRRKRAGVIRKGLDTGVAIIQSGMGTTISGRRDDGKI